jgi:hypothetical protein
MNKLDRLELQVRALIARVGTLESAQAMRRQRPKRTAAPRPADPTVAAREALWARYVLLDVPHRGRITKLAFAVKHRLGDPSDFRRFFSAADKRGIPEGSVPAVRFYRAINDAIAEARARSSGAIAPLDSHGNVTGSPLSAARPQ